MKQLAYKTTGISLVTRTQKWQVSLTVDGDHKHLGTFDTKEKAAMVYDAAVDTYAPGRRKNYIEVPEAPPGARYIPITQGYFALIDEDDYERVAKYRWSVRDNGKKSPYVASHVHKKRMPLHQFIMNAKNIDHIDGDTLNNRKCNLRIATIAQNGHNARKQRVECSSKYKGICWTNGRWMVSISVDGDQKTFGYYSDEKQAALAYNEAAKVIYKEFAWLNEVDAEITEETLAKVNNRLKGLKICDQIP